MLLRWRIQSGMCSAHAHARLRNATCGCETCKCTLQLEIKLALAMFVGRFHVRAAPQTSFTTVEELADNATSFVTLHQKGGVWLNMQPRALPNA